MGGQRQAALSNPLPMQTISQRILALAAQGLRCCCAHNRSAPLNRVS